MKRDWWDVPPLTRSSRKHTYLVEKTREEVRGMSRREIKREARRAKDWLTWEEFQRDHAEAVDRLEMERGR